MSARVSQGEKTKRVLEKCLEKLTILSDNYPSGLARVLPPSEVHELSLEVAQLIPDEHDEYMQPASEDGPSANLVEVRLQAAQKESARLRDENQTLHVEIRDLQQEVAALREMNDSKQSIYTSRIDTLQQELHVLRSDRTALYEAAAGLEEARAARIKTEEVNARLSEENARVTAEISRLRSTNSALTQQLFADSAGSEPVSRHSGSPDESPRGRKNSHALSESVMNVLTGRQEESNEHLLQLLARLHQLMLDEQLRHDQESSALHARMDHTSPRSPSNPISTNGISNRLSSIGAQMVNMFQQP